MKEHTIYSSEIDTDNSDMFQDELVNLNKTLNGRILIIADLGLWSGRKPAYKIIGNNLNEVLTQSQGECYKVWFDGHNIRAKDVHHDGTNYYLFREIREDKDLDVLLSKIFNGKHTDRDVRRYTKGLTCVKEIYGW